MPVAEDVLPDVVPEEIMNITTYLGANEGNDPTLYKAVTELGAWIGQGT